MIKSKRGGALPPFPLRTGINFVAVLTKYITTGLKPNSAIISLSRERESIDTVSR